MKGKTEDLALVVTVLSMYWLKQLIFRHQSLEYIESWRKEREGNP